MLFLIAVQTCGFIINTPPQFSSVAGYDALSLCISEFNLDVLIIMSNDRLSHDLSARYPKMTIIDLVKSGGVVSRSAAFRRHQQNVRVKEYFYGSLTENGRAVLSPHSTSIPFAKINIRRIGDGRSFV